MPLGKAYDKMIDSKFADMKNSAGRYAGSITAAQFLQRIVNDTPWAHLDIAGTAMAREGQRDQPVLGLRAGACACSTGSSPTTTKADVVASSFSDRTAAVIPDGAKRRSGIHRRAPESLRWIPGQARDDGEGFT